MASEGLKEILVAFANMLQDHRAALEVLALPPSSRKTVMAMRQADATARLKHEETFKAMRDKIRKLP